MSQDQDNRYLIYKIGNELYGSPLLSIREVLEFQKPKFMPNMVSYFSGVINVRGAIVGVVDLRSKLGAQEGLHRKTAMLLCDTAKGPISAVVDEVECVLQISEQDLEKNPPVESKLAQDYLIGVAKNNDSLITIIDLHKSLLEDSLKAA